VSPLSKPYLMAPTFRSIGLRPGGRRYLGSERELRLGVCFWFRLFNVAPETTARFSYIDDRSRSQSPPYGISSWPGWPARPLYGSFVRQLHAPLQWLISLVARAISRSASRAMSRLRLS
jgi:hypothetical protein